MRHPARQGRPIPGYTRHPGSIWIDSHQPTLPDNTWVAADHTGLVDKDHTLDGLLAKMKARNKELAEIAIAFITTESV